MKLCKLLLPAFLMTTVSYEGNTQDIASKVTTCEMFLSRYLFNLQNISKKDTTFILNAKSVENYLKSIKKNLNIQNEEIVTCAYTTTQQIFYAKIKSQEYFVLTDKQRVHELVIPYKDRQCKIDLYSKAFFFFEKNCVEEYKKNTLSFIKTIAQLLEH